VTEDNRAANAASEVARAHVCLAEAAALRAAGLPYGAASRAYYAVFHGVRAALYALGLEVKSHRAAI
jgi:uncharacterized protein (UPF0332 family)